jgi:lipoprotein-anchoring transpeptidase ErfK/SrfK
MGAVAAALLGLAAWTPPARAEMSEAMRLASIVPDQPTAGTAEVPGPRIVARVDLSDQRMYVYVDETLEHVFKVSTGRKGYGTPTGQYRALWLSPKHRSRKYDWAPMPWAVFFNGGYAVHGTTDINRLGRPASHGCVRLHPDNARLFFTLVKTSGRENTQIAIVR